MPNKEMGLIIKIIGIIGVILCGISLIIPWAGLWIGDFGFNIYPWATSSNILGQSEWDVFFIKTLTESSVFVTEAVIFSICMILAFIFTIIALFIGLAAFRKIGQKPSNSFIIAGILGIIAMVMSIIGVSQINSASTGGIGIGYGAGFYMIIFAFILYFVTFALQKLLLSAPAPGMAQQPMYQQPSYQQPQMMYSTQQPPVQQMPPPQTPPPQPQTQPSAQTQPPVKTTTSETNAAQKFCPDCGTQLLPNSKFCPSCGKQI